jgi:hypothetical protein
VKDRAKQFFIILVSERQVDHGADWCRRVGFSSGGSLDLLVDEAVGGDCWPSFARRWPATSRKTRAFVPDSFLWRRTRKSEKEGKSDHCRKISAARTGVSGVETPECPVYLS